MEEGGPLDPQGWWVCSSEVASRVSSSVSEAFGKNPSLTRKFLAILLLVSGLFPTPFSQRFISVGGSECIPGFPTVYVLPPQASPHPTALQTSAVALGSLGPCPLSPRLHVVPGGSAPASILPQDQDVPMFTLLARPLPGPSATSPVQSTVSPSKSKLFQSEPSFFP